MVQVPSLSMEQVGSIENNGAEFGVEVSVEL
jgi:hypothetical protein